MTNPVETAAPEAPAQPPAEAQPGPALGAEPTAPPTESPQPAEPATGEGGEQPSEAPPEPPSLPEDWREREEVQEALSAAQSRGDRAHNRELDEIQSHFEQRAKQVAQEAQATEVVTQVATSLQELATSDDVAVDVQRVLTRNETWAQLLSGAQYDAGAANFSKELSTAALYEGLSDEGREDLQDRVSALNRKIERGQTTRLDAWKDIMAERDKLQRSSFEAELRADIEKQVAARLEAEARDEKRKAQPAPTTVDGTGAGGTKTYRQMTPEERAALTPEQRDRLTAASLR